MAISKYDKKFEYGKILTEGDLNGMVDAINLSIDGVNNADAKSESAIKEATTAKNAVKTLEGLANSTEAMETLAGQVMQIEENKKDVNDIKVNLGEYEASDKELQPYESSLGILTINGTINTNYQGYYYDKYDVSTQLEVLVTILDGTSPANPWAYIWQLNKEGEILGFLAASGNPLPLNDFKLELLEGTTEIYVQRGQVKSIVIGKTNLVDDVKEQDNILAGQVMQIEENKKDIKDIKVNLGEYEASDKELQPYESSFGVLTINGTINTNYQGYYYDKYDVSTQLEVLVTILGGPDPANPWAYIWQLNKEGEILGFLAASGNPLPLNDFKLELLEGTTEIYVQRGQVKSIVIGKTNLADEVKISKGLAERMEEVEETTKKINTYKFVKLSPTQVISGSLINNAGNIVEHNVGKYVVYYDISGKKKIKMWCESNPNKNDMWAQFVVLHGDEKIMIAKPSEYPTPYNIELNNESGDTLYVSTNTLEGLEVFVDDGNIYNGVEEVQNLLNDYVLTDNIIAAWGDSLTYGQGGNRSYPKELNQLIKDDSTIEDVFKVINCGVQGDRITGILARQGGLGLFVENDIVVPHSGGVAVSFIIHSTGENGVSDFRFSYNGEGSSVINPIIINGVEYTVDSNKMIKKVEESGEDTTIKAGSTVLTYGARLSSVAYINIFYIGQNDPSIYRDKRIQWLKDSMEFATTKRNLIVSTAITTNDEIEHEYQEVFGNRYVNLRHEMSTRGIKIGIKLGLINSDTPDTAWNTIDAGASNKNGLLNDSIHWNTTGYIVLANIIFERLKSLGWLFKKQAKVVQ